MAQRVGKYKLSKKEAELSLANGGTIQGNLKLDGRVTSNYIDFLSGYQGNLTGTGVTVTDTEADTAGASAPGAGGIGAATVSASAVNIFSGTCDAAGALYLPKANVDTHLVIEVTAECDAANKITIHTSGSALANSTDGAAAGTVFSKQVIGNNTGGVAGSAVETGGTPSTPTTKKLGYTPAGAATNFLGPGSMLHFYAPVEDEWLVNVRSAPKGTGATGAFDVSDT